MSPPILHPAPLGPDSFAPFGTVIRFDAGAAWPVNGGTALRANTAALLDAEAGTVPRLALYRAAPQSLPLTLSLFERHPAAAQSFVALSVPRFLVVVAPPDPEGLPDVGRARAFVGRRGMGLSYSLNQWHTPLMALDSGGDLLMLMAEHGDERDCVEHPLPEPMIILEPPIDP